MHKITFSLPLPAGKGAGGWGQKIKLKAKSAGDNESTPPAGHPSGRDSQCRLGSAPADARGETPLPTTPLSKTPPVFHTVWKRLWTFPRLFHSLWKTMLKSTVCIAVCNPCRPRIRALQQKNTPPAVLWICIKNRTDKFPKPTASPTGCPQMPVDRTPGFPTENRKNPSTTTGLSRSERRRTPKNPQKNHPRTRISTIRQGKIRIFRTEPRRQKRQKVPAVAGYSGFPQFPAPYCSCFWMEG